MNSYKNIFLFILLLSFSTALAQKKTAHTYIDFNDFYKYIANGTEINFIPQAVTDSVVTTTTNSDSTIETIFSCKLNGMDFQYVAHPPEQNFPDYFIINKRKFYVDTGEFFEHENITGFGKTTLNNVTYLFAPSWPGPLCNGRYCTMQFDNLFQITDTGMHFVATYGWQQPQNIYCDINKDGQLDMISFTGNFTNAKIDSLRDSTDPKYDFMIQAMTLQDHKWVPMKDKNNKEYFISIQTDDFFELNSFKIIDGNWFRKL